MPCERGYMVCHVKGDAWYVMLKAMHGVACERGFCGHIVKHGQLT